MSFDRLDDDPRWDQLVHYFAGELPSDQAAAMRDWIEADPERRARVAQWQEVWDLAARPPQRWDVAAELRRVRAEDEARAPHRIIARIDPADSTRRPDSTHLPDSTRRSDPTRLPDFTRLPGTRPQPLRTLVRLAAVLLLAVGAGLVWRMRPAPIATPADHAAAGAEYRTRAGQRLIMRLPDGTQVILAPGSVLRPSPTYGQGARDVRLEGEAYFVVTHDSTRPFAVHTPRAVAHDLGTRFVVRAYPDDPATDIAVAEGLVAVARPAQRADQAQAQPVPADSVVLSVRQRARITDAGRLEVTRGVALDGYLGWTEGRLVFTGTPLREVARQLARWYDIDVRLADPRLGDRRLTAMLYDESPEQALDLVADVLELKVSRVAGSYTIGRP